MKSLPRISNVASVDDIDIAADVVNRLFNLLTYHFARTSPAVSSLLKDFRCLVIWLELDGQVVTPREKPCVSEEWLARLTGAPDTRLCPGDSKLIVQVWAPRIGAISGFAWLQKRTVGRVLPVSVMVSRHGVPIMHTGHFVKVCAPRPQSCPGHHPDVPYIKDELRSLMAEFFTPKLSAEMARAGFSTGLRLIGNLKSIENATVVFEAFKKLYAKWKLANFTGMAQLYVGVNCELTLSRQPPDPTKPKVWINGRRSLKLDDKFHEVYIVEHEMDVIYDCAATSVYTSTDTRYTVQRAEFSKVDQSYVTSIYAVSKRP